MRKITSLKIQFLFDPINTWQRTSNFDHDLSGFFLKRGLEVSMVSDAQNSGERIYFISRITTMPVLDNKAGMPAGAERVIAKIKADFKKDQESYKS